MALPLAHISLSDVRISAYWKYMRICGKPQPHMRISAWNRIIRMANSFFYPHTYTFSDAGYMRKRELSRSWKKLHSKLLLCSASLAFLTAREAEKQVHSCNKRAFPWPKNESVPGPYFGLSCTTSKNVDDDDDMANGVLKVSCLSEARWWCRMVTDSHYSSDSFTHTQGTQSTFFNF